MNAEESEAIFERYLRDSQLAFERDVIVSGQRNVDFGIGSPINVLCDVKEVRASPDGKHGRLDAGGHLKNDLSKLRKKFGKSPPNIPVVLVTMNFSDKPFTGLSIQTAALGDIGVEIEEKARTAAHHLARGNASLTLKTNTTISGILAFDVFSGNHHLFKNPFAANSLANNYFYGVQHVEMSRSADESEIKALAQIIFFPVSPEEANQ